MLRSRQTAGRDGRYTGVSPPFIGVFAYCWNG